MATETLSLYGEKDYRGSLERAARVLREGGLVAFPTETVYGVGARADSRDAVEALRRAKGRQENKPFTVHVGRREEVERFVPNPSPLAQRLVRKAWPGPVTLIFTVEEPGAAAVVRETGKETEELIYHRRTVGIRCPDHDIAAQLLVETGVPVVAASANRAGHAPPHSATGVAAAFDGKLDLILDGGPARYAKPSTVVRVQGDRYEIVREGVFDARMVKRLASMSILFVCSGNTCRSPMAAGLCRQALTRRYGCTVAELEGHHVQVHSAGASAMVGLAASNQAVAAMSKLGIDLSAHRSQPLTAELINGADHVFCMTRSHLEAVSAEAPGSKDKVSLLGGDDEINDPFGGTVEQYQTCAERIDAACQRILSEIRL